MGVTILGKILGISYGLLGLIAITSWASGGERGVLILNTSVAIIIVSAMALYLIDRLHNNRSILGGHLLVLWKWESANSKDTRREQEERERQQRRELEETERQQRMEQEETERQQRKREKNQSNEFENLQSPHEILGISPDATQEEIKARFRELSIKFHPDKEKGVFADELMKKINWAYDELKT